MAPRTKNKGAFQFIATSLVEKLHRTSEYDEYTLTRLTQTKSHKSPCNMLLQIYSIEVLVKMYYCENIMYYYAK
jgi:hypothetical protein